MDTLRALELRHSVRSYESKELTGDVLASVQKLIKDINNEAGLHIQLVQNRPKAFDSFLSHYGKFQNVQNYFAMVAKRGKDEEIGYYGQKLVLECQKLGLNTCWVGGTFGRDKDAYTKNFGEKLYLVIAVGYGTTFGNPHKGKGLGGIVEMGGAITVDSAEWPAWFLAGAKAALKAPTALNSQNFKLGLGTDGNVTIKMGIGTFPKVDKGIVKYNFEIGAASKGHTVKWA